MEHTECGVMLEESVGKHNRNGSHGNLRQG